MIFSFFSYLREKLVAYRIRGEFPKGRFPSTRCTQILHIIRYKIHFFFVRGVYIIGCITSGCSFSNRF